MSEGSSKSIKSKFSKLQAVFASYAGQAQEGASEAISIFTATEGWAKINKLSNSMTKAMDAGWHDHKGAEMLGGIKLTPSNHRFMWDDGHTVSESFQRASDVGNHAGWSDLETFVEWAKAYSSDLSSTSGMPIFGKMTDDIYVFMTKTLNLEEGTAQDFVTINGSEVITAITGGTIAAVALLFAWKAEDKETFSRAIGSIGVASLVATNPVALSVLIVSLAMGYNKMVCQKAVGRGAIVSASSILVSSAIGGPFIVGFVPALVAAWYINKKMGVEFDVLSFTKGGWVYLRSPEFKILAENYYNEVQQIILQQDPQAKVS